MASKKRGLGRGLDALLQSSAGASPPEETRNLPLTDLRPNENQPRRDFDAAALEDLSASIRSQGLVQPIVVTKNVGGGYLIVAGERRWRAAGLAGLETVPVVVIEVKDDRHLLELALVENLQREDLNAVEEALAFRSLADDFGLSQAALAIRVGKARSTVANSLRLLNLPDPVLALIRRSKLTAGQARPLLALKDAASQVTMATQAALHDWSARDLEKRCAEPAPSVEPKLAPARDVHDSAAEEALTRRLQTRVELRRQAKGGGQLRIHFHSEEELMRLYDHLVAREAT